jgi:hypothetical protein
MLVASSEKARDSVRDDTQLAPPGNREALPFQLVGGDSYFFQL